MYLENLELKDGHLEGKLSFTELKQCVISLGYTVNIYNGDKGLFSVSSTLRYRMGRNYFVYNFRNKHTTCFLDVVKEMQKLGFDKDDEVEIWVTDETNPLEIVELHNGEIAAKDDDIVLTEDTEEYYAKDEVYYCKTDDCYYADGDDLVYIDGDYYNRDDDDIFYCEHCQEYCVGDSYEVHTDYRNTEIWCEYCTDHDARKCDDCGDYWCEDEIYHSDQPDWYVCRNCYDNNYYFCSECESTVHYDYWDSDSDCCCDCANKSRDIKPYHWHHNNGFTNRNMLFIKGDKIPIGSSDEIKTCGIELEVDKDTSEGQKDAIDSINELIDENEIYYEHDGSLSSGGFELITGIHTFESLKQMKWKQILQILQDNGFSSHNGGRCGLHVHISRKFFGRDDNEQSNAIGKIYAFYSLFWDDLVKASRRKTFTYCDNAFVETNKEDLTDRINNNVNATRQYLFDKAKSKDGSHGVALNNTNDNTFEFRLGRGTLKYESFMAWLDLTFTIAKNSKKIAIKNLVDCDKWLSGISKDTAFYLKSRNAFVESEIIEKLTREVTEICA